MPLRLRFPRIVPPTSIPATVPNNNSDIYLGIEGGNISYNASIPNNNSDIYLGIEGGNVFYNASIPNNNSDIYLGIEGGNISYNASIPNNNSDIYLGIEGGNVFYNASIPNNNSDIYLGIEGGNVSYGVSIPDVFIDIYLGIEGGGFTIITGAIVPGEISDIYLGIEGGNTSYSASTPNGSSDIYLGVEGGDISYNAGIDPALVDIYLGIEGGGASYSASAPNSNSGIYLGIEGGAVSYAASIASNSIDIYLGVEGGGFSVVVPNAAIAPNGVVDIYLGIEGGDVLILAPEITHFLYDISQADLDRILSILQQELREILTEEEPILAELEWAEDPGKFKVSGAIGTVANALPYHDPLVPDEVNSIVASFTDETTVITPPSMQDFSENRALLRLGDEVIAYRDVEVVSYEPLVQRFSYLIRGIENLSGEIDPPAIPIHADNEDILIGSIGFLRGGSMPWMHQKLKGKLLVPIDYHTASMPDEVNTLAIQMDSASMRVTPPSITDFWSGDGQLIKIEEEIIGFRDADIISTSPLQYNLSYLLRGQLNSSISSHSAGIPIEIGFPTLFDGSSLRPTIPAISRKELDLNKWKIKTPGVFCMIEEDAKYKRIPFLGSSGALLEFKVTLIQHDTSKTLTLAVNRILASDLFDITREPRIAPMMELPQGTALSRAEIWIGLDQWGKTKAV